MGTVLWIPRGLPASGKTTWAREMVDRQPIGSIVRLNRDDVRAMMFGPDYRTPRHEGEERVSAVQHGPIVELLRSGADVIVDDTNLRVRHVKTFMQMAARAGAQAQIVDRFLDVDVEECVRRDAARPRPVGEVVIRGMWEKHLRGGRRPHVPFLDEAVTGTPYIPAPGTPDAVMVDIDGTVALMAGRGPYDTSRYHEDTANGPVVDLVRSAASLGQSIVFCSGRSEEFRAVTEQWIREHVLPGGWQLFMRPAGDVRNDAVVKLELFDEHIRSRFHVRYVLDDRQRVVDAYRSIGLTVLQVAEGNF